MPWEPAEFLIATIASGPVKTPGYIYRGLGLHIRLKASPKGRRPPTWTLTHLGTGHRIASIVGKVADAFPIATEIAECGEWDFDGLDGWRNVDPELPKKFMAVVARHPKRARCEASGEQHERSQEVAAQIATARAQ